MKKLIFMILLVLLIPASSHAVSVIMGGNVNTSSPYPIVTTNAATLILATSATLNGTAYNYNSAGNSYFNYGLTSSYGSQTSQVAFAANTVTTTFNAAVSGLTTGSTYHFQACVSNGAGISCGGDLTFTPNNPLVRIGAIKLGNTTTLMGLNVDSTGSFLYYCEQAVSTFSFARKVNLSTFTSSGSVALDQTFVNICDNAVLDSVNNFYYVHSSLGAGYDIFKIATAGMTLANTLSITAFVFDNLGRPALDSINSKIYWPGTTNASVQQINRLDLASFTNDANINATAGGLAFDGVNTIYSGANSTNTGFQQSTAVPFAASTFLASGASSTRSVVSDFAHNAVYYLSEAATSIYKINTTSFTASVFATGISSLNLAIDVSKGYIFYGTETTPVVIHALRISDGSDAFSLTLNSGEGPLNNYPTCMIVDQVNHNLYVGTDAGILVKVQIN